MVRTQIAGASSEDCELILFEPNLGKLEEKCLLAPEILTSITTDNNMVLVLKNHGCEPIYLKTGQMLGWVCDATLCSGWEADRDAIMSVETPLSSAAGMSINTLIAGSDTGGEEVNQPSERFLKGDS